MAKMNVFLPDPMKAWVEEHLKKDGRFNNTSDYMCHLIRLDQERIEAIDSLQKVIDGGIGSGDPQPFDFKALKARMLEQHGNN